MILAILVAKEKFPVLLSNSLTVKPWGTSNWSFAKPTILPLLIFISAVGVVL